MPLRRRAAVQYGRSSKRQLDHRMREVSSHCLLLWTRERDVKMTPDQSPAKEVNQTPVRWFLCDD